MERRTRIVLYLIVLGGLIAICTSFYRNFVIENIPVFLIEGNEPLLINQVNDQMIACEWSPVHFLFFSENVFDKFIYYSHFVPSLLSLIFGLYVFIKSRHNPLARTLMGIVSLFFIWSMTDMILWATDLPQFTMFFWSVTNLIEPLIYCVCLYFTYIFLNKKPPSFKSTIFAGLLLLPTFILLPTHFNLEGFDLTNCDRDAVEGILVFINYFIEAIFITWAFVLILKKYFKSENENQKSEVLTILIGLALFLISFTLGNIIGSYTGDWRYGQYGLLGMPFFIGFLAYSIVKYRTFNIKIFGTQALVIVIWIILFSKLFTPLPITEKFIDILVFFITVPFGVLLIRSVIKEVKLAEQQYEMVATVSHQLRTPLTPVLGYAAMMDQGDFDGHPEELKDAQHRLLISTQRLRNIINDFLQMFELEGEHKMDSVKTPLQDIVNEAMAGVKENYEQKKLYLKLENPLNVNPILVGETKLLVQAINNLLDNAQRYTIEGGSTVQLSVEKNRAIIKVTDTGIGLDENDKQRLFTKFYRSDAAKEVRPDGSGLGLPIVKTVVEAHGGKVHAESEGRGKGTTFIIELPLKKQ